MPQALTPRVRAAARPNLPKLVGQLIVARFTGRRPSASFFARVRAGQIGSVILFGDNTAGGVAATRGVDRALQGAAQSGGNPPLLIMTDQEGGGVRRLPGPPALAPAGMGSTSVARRAGRAAGRLLRSAGVNVDLAPVADVERAAGSFLGTRSFGSNPQVVAARACAFAAGLASARVGYTLKHFPGLGRAVRSTDLAPVSITASRTQLRTDYAAYRACGAGPMAMIMVSSASYPHLVGPRPAVMSPAVYSRELPLAVGATGSLTISDDLQTPALAAQTTPARTSIDAGLDLVMYASTEQGSATAYPKLLADARAGTIPLSRLQAAVARIRALKRLVAP